VYGRGENVRDWIHVLDHCRGIDAALRKGLPGEVYNFGGHQEIRNIDLTRMLLELLGKPQTLIEFVSDRPGHDLRYAIDCSKAERELGWKPQVTFRQGIRDTIDWYKANSAWVNRIKTGDYLKYYEQQYGDRHRKSGEV
jgi:dTDP-glucose 4,6-dehydratase